MAVRSLSEVKTLVEASRLNSFRFDEYQVGHRLFHDHYEPSEINVLYKRQRTPLGKGQYGEVHMERLSSETSRVPRVRAVKELHKPFCVKHSIEWRRELEAMAILSQYKEQGPFVSFYGWYEDDATVYISMEYFELGDLSQYIPIIQDECEVQRLGQQIAQGLKIMHGEHIVHRDLKPKNIFVESKSPLWSIKIADFGSSKRPSEITGLKTDAVGTVGYLAPEYCSFMRPDSLTPEMTAAVDIWSFGCILYELFTKNCPFREENRAFRKYCENSVLPDELEQSFASIEAKQVIRDLLHPRSECRPSAEEASSILWLATDNDEDNDGRSSDPLTRSDGLEVTAVDQDISPRPSREPSSLRSAGSNISPAKTARLDDELAVSKSTSPLPSNTPHLEAPATPNPASSHASETPPRSRPMSTVHTEGESEDDLTIDNGQIQKSSLQPPGARDDFSEDGSLSQHPGRITTLTTDVVEPIAPQLSQRRLSNLPRSISPKDPESLIRTEPPAASDPDSHPLAVVATEDAIQQLEPWFVTSLAGQILCMSFGSLGYSVLPKPECELCDIVRRTRGQARPGRVQNELHICDNCEGRYLCELCARHAIVDVGDAHHADHYLRSIEPTLSYRLAPFLEQKRILPSTTATRGELSPSFGQEWLASDRGLSAPPALGSGKLRVRLVLQTPPGLHEVSVRLRIRFDPQKCTSKAIGLVKKKMLALPTNSWGTLRVGAQPVVVSTNTSHELGQHYIPQGFVEKPINRDPEHDEDCIDVEIETPVRVQPDQALEIVIWTSYEPSIFKAGSPFKCYLDFVNLSQHGDRVQLASVGERLRRKEIVNKQKQIDKEIKHDRRIKHATSALNVATMGGALAKTIEGFAARRGESHLYHDFRASMRQNPYHGHQDYAPASQATSVYGGGLSFADAWEDISTHDPGYPHEQPQLHHGYSDFVPDAASYESVGEHGAGSATHTQWDPVGQEQC